MTSQIDGRRREDFRGIRMSAVLYSMWFQQFYLVLSRNIIP